MKKNSVILIFAVLVLPAVAQPSAIYLYGDPANIKLLEALKLNMPEVAEQKMSLAPIEEQKIEKPKTEEVKVEEPKVEEPKTEELKVEEPKVEQKTEENTVEKKSEKSEGKKARRQKNKEARAKEKQEEIQQAEPQKTEEQKLEVKAVSNPKAKFPHGLQLGVGVSSTSGLNAFVGYNNKNFESFWWKRFGVRVDFATYSMIRNTLNKSINKNVDEDGIKIDDGLRVNNVDINAKHIGALIDFYPFGDTWFFGGLRVSGGYMAGNFDLNADIVGAKKSGGIEFVLGDRKYRYEGTEMPGKTDIKWKYSGPYLGAGFDLGMFAGFKLYFDAGVVFSGNNASVNLNVPVTSDLRDITSGTPQEVVGEYETKFKEAKAKTTKDAQDELDKIDYYPIVKLGFMYRF